MHDLELSDPGSLTRPGDQRAARAAFRNSLAGAAAAGLGWMSLVAGEAARGALHPIFREFLGYDLSMVLGGVLPLGALLAVATLAGRVLGGRAREAAAADPDQAQAGLAGACMGAAATGTALAAWTALEAWSPISQMTVAMVPVLIGVGVFGRRAFLALEGPAARARPAAAPAVPDLYPTMAAAGLGLVSFMGLGVFMATVIEWCGLESWFRIMTWTDGGNVLVWSGLAASLVATAVPAALAGALVAKTLPEARPRAFGLAALACFLLPAILVLGETGGMTGLTETFAIFTMLASCTGSGALAALATHAALPETQDRRRLTAA